jgi:hypothetical protein
MTKRSPRVTAHLRNTIKAAREQAERAYRFAPGSYTYSAFLAARRAEALAAKKKRPRSHRAPGTVPSSAIHGVDYRPPVVAIERHIADEGEISGGRTA